MVIERFTAPPEVIYRRLTESGRGLPDGLAYVNSWVADDGRCFQVMETGEPALFDTWTAFWDDLCDFEIVPVVTSAEAASRHG